MSNEKRILPELVTAGIYDSRLLYSQSTQKTVNRRVSMFELELPIGNGAVSWFGGDKYDVNENMIICAKPGTIRHTELPFRCRYLHVIVEDRRYAEILRQLPDVIEVEDRTRFDEIFGELIGAYSEQSELSEITVASKLLELIGMLLKENKLASSGVCAKCSNAEAVRTALDYIGRHYAENITLTQIASEVHLSEIYFHNMFRAAVGTTPHKYLLGIRLANAKRLLATSGMSFAEVASSCGFPTQSYFSYVFKREFGKTPKQYLTEISISWDTFGISP